MSNCVKCPQCKESEKFVIVRVTFELQCAYCGLVISKVKDQYTQAVRHEIGKERAGKIN